MRQQPNNMLKTQFKLGRNPLAVESENVDDFFIQCGVFSKVPDKCGNCQSDDLRPHGDKKPDDDWVFHSIRCHSCGYQLRFGRRKDGELFLKLDDGWQAPYTRGENSSARRTSGDSAATERREHTPRWDGSSTYKGGGGNSAPPVEEEDDIPF